MALPDSDSVPFLFLERGEGSGEMIEFQQVTYTYPDQEKDQPSLKDISITIPEGSFVSLIGANGSGKSTLARHINGLLTPSQGKVIVCGIETSQEEQVWEIRRHAGMVFQNPDNQLVAPTVEDDVAFGLENLGLPPQEIERRMDEAMRDTGVQRLRKQPPHHLSGGEKQRVSLAGIIAMQPQILILDEATSMLDPAGRREVMNVIRNLHRRHGLTVVQITHHMEEALYGDTVIIMQDGRIVMQGTTREVFHHPDILLAAGLNLPFAVRLRYELQQRGWILSSSGIDEDELAEEICTLLSKI